MEGGRWKNMLCEMVQEANYFFAAFVLKCLIRPISAKTLKTKHSIFSLKLMWVLNTWFLDPYQEIQKRQQNQNLLKSIKIH